MRETYILLTKSVLQKHLSELLALDQSTMKNLAEDWNAEHFLHDLPGKWQCSRLALAENELAGFSINSIKPTGVHVHRIAVSPLFQKRGIGRRLLRETAQSAFERSIKCLTLRVAAGNESAITFYRWLGFVEIGTGAGGEYLDLAIEANELLRDADYRA